MKDGLKGRGWKQGSQVGDYCKFTSQMMTSQGFGNRNRKENIDSRNILNIENTESRLNVEIKGDEILGSSKVSGLECQV